VVSKDRLQETISRNLILSQIGDNDGETAWKVKWMNTPFCSVYEHFTAEKMDDLKQ